jgi:hypothetical protein
MKRKQIIFDKESDEKEASFIFTYPKIDYTFKKKDVEITYRTNLLIVKHSKLIISFIFEHPFIYTTPIKLDFQFNEILFSDFQKSKNSFKDENSKKTFYFTSFLQIIDGKLHFIFSSENLDPDYNSIDKPIINCILFNALEVPIYKKMLYS